MFSVWLTFIFLAWTLSSVEGGSCYIKKCCPFEEMMTIEGCSAGGPVFQVPPDAMVKAEELDCPEGMYPSDIGFKISYSDCILYHTDDTPLPPTKDFCLDWSDEENATIPFVCFVEEKELFVYYSIGLMVSMPFLLATILVYALIKRLRNFHGKCVVYHSSSLLLGYICLALTQNKVWEHSIILCQINGYAIQLFFLAAFAWLNVMCWDIYWSFSGSRNISGSVREREKKKLTAYSIYAWCTPLVILAITLVIDLSSSVPDDSVFKPRVGVEKCFFSDKTGQWIYFYFPLGLILICNSYIFVVTTYRVWSIRREAEALNGNDNLNRANRKDKERYSLYLKLFIIMGINWVLELFSSFIKGPVYFWIVVDITNSLQGVFIFIIFVLKKKVRIIVWEKLYDIIGKKTSGTIANGTKNTDTSRSSHSINSIEMTNTKVMSDARC